MAKRRKTSKVKLAKRNVTKGDKVQTKIMPVRGDTVSFWAYEGGFRYALVLNAQDKEATLLTVDNEQVTLPYEDLNEVHDNRMELLRKMPEDEAIQHREDYLEKWIAKCQERADRAAIARGAAVDEHGRILRHKPGRKPSDEKVARVNKVRDSFIEFVEKSDKPVTKSMIGDLIPESIYSDVINAAIESGKVERNGKRRGTNYTVPGRTYESNSNDTQVQTVDADVLNVVIDFIGKNGPTSKSQLIDEYSLSNSEWNTLRFSLQEDERISIEGERRGTRYVRN